MEDLMNVNEVSEMFGVNRTTIFRWIREKGLPSVKVGGARKFKRAWLEHWANNQEIRNAASVETPFGTGRFISENGDWVTVEMGYQYLVSFERKDIKFVVGV